MTEMEQRMAVLESRMDRADELLGSLREGVDKNTGLLIRLDEQLKLSAQERERRRAEEEQRATTRQRHWRYVLMLGTGLTAVGTWLSEHWHRVFK